MFNFILMKINMEKMQFFNLNHIRTIDLRKEIMKLQKLSYFNLINKYIHLH